jgi:hypothetical protein
MSDDCYKGIPKTVRIGCYVFRVEVSEFEDSEAAGTFGHMNPISQKIRLRPGMTTQNLANTFIHEVAHGITWLYGAGVHTGGSYEDTEEDFVTKIANGLCAFWQDNPKAVVWWTKILRLEKSE